MNVDNLINAYKRNQSIYLTAKESGVSIGVVRKTLITAGIYTSPLVEQISKLSAMGLSEVEIAKKLSLSTSEINANKPYKKGSYLNKSKSVNAVRIKKHREKKVSNDK